MASGSSLGGSRSAHCTMRPSQVCTRGDPVLDRLAQRQRHGGSALPSCLPPPPPTQGRQSTPVHHSPRRSLCDPTAATAAGRRPARSTHRLSGPRPSRGGPRHRTSPASGPSGGSPGRPGPSGSAPGRRRHTARSVRCCPTPVGARRPPSRKRDGRASPRPRPRQGWEAGHWSTHDGSPPRPRWRPAS